jgi:uncharacterized protein YuzE
MKLHYYSETDSLYIDLNSSLSSDSKEMAEGLVVDYDEHGRVIGLDLQHASESFDLLKIELVNLPLGALRGGTNDRQ